MIDFQELKSAMGELERDTVVELLKGLMAEGGDGADKALAACQEGMNIVGDRYDTGEYFVADLIFAGELMTEAVNIIKPAIAKDSGANVGKMVLCTVQGDLHDIGKNIVKAMLEASGIEVVDLGIDVAPASIVKTASEQGIKVVGLSGVLTLAIDSMKATVEAFKAAGTRENIKIIIGGAPVTEDYCKQVGADAWSVNAAKSVDICRSWLV